jgi:FkbM family methyltransferase
MTEPGETLFSMQTQLVKAKHRRLGYSVELFVPLAARHRSAVKAFIDGAYHEPFSHWAYVQILSHKTRKNAIHAGAFFGDMLDTYSRAANQVFAFEPVLENYFFAKRNVEHLKLKNVYLMNAGLGAEDRLLEIVVSDAAGETMGGGATFRGGAAGAQRKTQVVPVFRIDSLPIRDVGLIQLDVEGFERPVIEGAMNLIRAERPVILVEDNAADCAPLLEAEGYRFSFKKSGLSYWSSDEDKTFVDSLLDAPEGKGGEAG